MKRKKIQGDIMNQIAMRIAKAPAGNPAEMAMLIKTEAPALADLNSDQLEQIARMVIAERLTAELNRQVDLAGIDWAGKRETFLNDAGSPHTRRAYAASLAKLEAWASRQGINPLELTAAGADQFIRDLKAEGNAATTRRHIAGISAFYTWLERYHAQVTNPVRGTRIRPPKANIKETVIPDDADYAVILAGLPATEKAMVVTMATRGLRAGALPTLELKNGKYHGNSKGKALTENNTAGVTLPARALKAIKKAGLDVKKPFAWETRRGTANTANAIERRINYHIGKLYKAGKITAAYSCHDFRHYFAVNEYRKKPDIFRLSKLLNHAGIQVTQAYLQSLGIEL